MSGEHCPRWHRVGGIWRIGAGVGMFVVTASTQAEDVQFHTGNGAVGSADSQVRLVQRSGPFFDADFAAARSGNAAIIVDRYGTWHRTLSTDSAAQWVCVDSQRTPVDVLLAQDFVIQSARVTSASIQVRYSVDDVVGASQIPGFYLNGIAIPGAPAGEGDWRAEYTFTNSRVATLLHPGINTFYCYGNDTRLTVSGTMYSVHVMICLADVDDGSRTGTPDGAVTIDDLLYYLELYSQGDARADFDDGTNTGRLDGGITIDDLLYYLGLYEAGC